jgi:hypothetical protein
MGGEGRSVEWLEEATEDQTNIMEFLRVYPPLDPLRSDPRFTDLRRRVGLQ